jgi:hypothetical protein
MQEKDPAQVRLLCTAHRREARWRNIAPPSGYGCWGCPECSNSQANATITVSTGRGQFTYDHSLWIGDHEYDREEGMYIGVSAEDVADYIHNHAWDAHLSDEFDVSVDDITPEDFEDFMNNDRYEVVRQHIYDHFTLYHIECSNCGSSISGDID